MDIMIRQETVRDFNEVYELVKAAFKTMPFADGDEQDLVARLRNSEAFIPALSLVAESEGVIVGHVLFTRLKIGDYIALALAPVSVLPQFQRQGIGGQLILEGHRIAKALGYGAVVLIGHADYYPRFGYQPASLWHLVAPFEVPDEAFMAAELVPGALNGVSGMIEYAKEFFETN
jgi:predicted N-acetyltransferase YhbS